MESNSSVMLFMSHFRFRDCQPYIVNANVLKLMEYEMLNSIKQSLNLDHLNFQHFTADFRVVICLLLGTCLRDGEKEAYEIYLRK